MRYIMRRSCLFLVMIAVIVFTGCGQKKKEDPVTVTLWHVYGGQTESPLNDLIETNTGETVGEEGKTLDDATITGGINWYFKTVEVVE